MKNKKYCIVLINFSFLLTILLINIDRNIDLWPTNNKIHLSSKPMQQVLFRVGMMYLPIDLDPQIAWDSASINTIDQVCEGLFAYNLSDPNNSIIPNLALSGTWNPTGTEYTCILRQGVTFHDGAPFNADAVIFTWNRMSWALNTTGTNIVGVTQVAELYEFPDGTPIVSSITKNNDYNITFVLNDPYVPFEALLCFSASYILSPLSTPVEAYIVTATGDIVGTGPFVYDNYISGVEVNFHAFDNYWKGKANITEMSFQGIADSNARNAALLAGDVHFISATESAWYSVIKSSPDIIFLNTSTKSMVIQYMGMNNNKINQTFRQAISYAINYAYITEEIMEGNVDRLESPIPEGIKYANWTLDEAKFNISYARTIMQSIGYGFNGTDTSLGWKTGPDCTAFDLDYDDVWIYAATHGQAALSVSFTYNVGNQMREDILALLMNNLPKIGITVSGDGMTWSELIYRLYEVGNLNRDMLDLWWIGWGFNYNDPSTFINPLFTNRSIASNGAQYNGYTAAIEAGRDPLALNDNVQLLMEAALSEVDPMAREALYDRIQELLIEEDYPLVWGFVPYIFHAYDNHLTGFQQNAMEKLYFYPCEWKFPILPELFIINSDAEDPDTDGNFNITWSPSAYADNYSLYVSSSVITDIDGSVTVLLDEITNTSYEASGYSNGNYYFLVVARNGNGNTTSSNLLVYVEYYVEIPDPPSPFTLASDAGNPDVNGNFNLTWSPSTNAVSYSLYIYSSEITEINSSLTLLLEEVTDLFYEVFNFLDGTYFFAVVAKNAYGTTLSNNIEVVVEIEEPAQDPGIPGFEMWTLIFTITSVGLITILRKKKKYT